MQRPTAVPRIPASASGVSTQRSSPKRSRSPAVARKTPPERPTSSPMTRTRSSRSSSTWSASFTASTRVSSAKDASQLGEVVGEGGGRAREGRVEDEGDVRRRLRLRLLHSGSHELLRRRPLGRNGVVVDEAAPPQVPLVERHALVLALLLDALRIHVAARVVGCPVRGGAVGNRL